MIRKPRSAEDVCIEYAIAVYAVREQTFILRNNPCTENDKPESADWNQNYPGSPGTPSCLDELFSAPKGPDGEIPRYQEFYEEMCGACKKKLDAIAERKNARIRLGAAKRAVEAIGKRKNS